MRGSLPFFIVTLFPTGFAVSSTCRILKTSLLTCTFPNGTLPYLSSSFIGVNTLSSVWSKNPLFNQAGDHAAFSDLVESVSWLTFEHLAESVRAFLQPILPRTLRVIGSCHSVAGGTTDAPRQVTELGSDGWVCADVNAHGFVNLFVSRIKGSGPAMGVGVCSNRSAERSLAYEG